MHSKKELTREGELHKFLSFRLGKENFGIAILNIKEIIEYGSITEVPMMPEFVRGAINLRGHIVPVMDLAIRLSRQSDEISKRTCIVIVEVETNQVVLDVGIVVDAVNEVMDIHPEDIDPAPSFGGSLRTDFIRGMGKMGEKFIILLEIDKVISLEDMHALQAAAGDMIDATDKHDGSALA
ncbi:MAG: chemotaxis protein CheW [Gammaproteobacteria bacterium]|nr:chemotaxis protein CheW [Gammaproteobacteria bacterium]